MILFRESVGNVLKYGVKYHGVRRTRAYFPALFYCHTSQQTAVYTLKLTHNDHDGYVQFFTNLTQKRLSYQNGRSICINLRPPVVHSLYSPSYDSSNTPMYEIDSWKMVIYDRKIAAIFTYIERTLGNIYCKYAIVYCGYRLHLIIYLG